MTDITELAQMKGQKVEGSYYLAECTDCGKMYPSNKLNGGEPLFSGDYGECYCPHCNADDAAIGDCGDTAAIAWNYQQGRIDALVEALEKVQGRIAELEDAEQKLCAANVTLDARAELAERRLAEIESRTVTAAAADVLAERQRQMTAEGWTPEGDDRYTYAELSIAAQCYAAHSGVMGAGVPVQWPWDDEWWKPSDRRRNLIKAGALILAEIERLDRAAGIKWEAE
ncbi:hypothetical protein [Klebsiella quasipneumoniae]|uniref:hypothetical protein n=1 Tax=Klebsiella quasipneumoniae TaxID=1463165 RepID=UPI0010D874AF|nr:hypothetical protein [Klebsiella quasipneumoniae]UDC53453.1 hypothetical protein LGM24_18220 [Klebsiella quasipneumoniae subsp. quasipneumoniae]VGP27252.1 hypothetical protein SB02110_03353 [Klebsiella quasipneumoniae subsp. quasipneumoniae]